MKHIIKDCDNYKKLKKEFFGIKNNYFLYPHDQLNQIYNSQKPPLFEDKQGRKTNYAFEMKRMEKICIYTSIQ